MLSMMNERLARYPADQKHFLHWVCGFVLQLLHVWRTTKLHQRHVTLEICISTKPCSHFSQQECHCVILISWWSSFKHNKRFTVQFYLQIQLFHKPECLKQHFTYMHRLKSTFWTKLIHLQVQFLYIYSSY